MNHSLALLLFSACTAIAQTAAPSAQSAAPFAEAEHAIAEGIPQVAIVKLEAALNANGFHAQALSGDVPQQKRLRFLRDFHNGDLAVLIGTDVASRGLHVPGVSQVFNYDFPQDPED